MAHNFFLGEYSSASDVYAFSIMLNELLTEEVPFPSLSQSEIMMKVVMQKTRPRMFAAPASDPVGSRLMSLVRSGWNQDCALRMTFHALSADLNQLLSASVEIARNGTRNTASGGAADSGKGAATLPTSPHTPEAAITVLAEWMTTSCGLLADDSASLAHTLVTTKSITSVELLREVVQRHPDLLTRDLNIPAVLEIQIKKALLAVKQAQLQLSDLSIDQVCLLLDSHNLHSSIKPIMIENEISGAVVLKSSFFSSRRL
jgi:serine/threonine protein kinase